MDDVIKRIHGELPPRARRIPIFCWQSCCGFRTTSACAENTTPCTARGLPPWNYLRVRGEYTHPVTNPTYQTELPPRARRIPGGQGAHFALEGTTSACAENTSHKDILSNRVRNYLRVRGEYDLARPIRLGYRELPPRARRILANGHNRGLIGGTTSACAENTAAHSFAELILRNYLRVRGEYRDAISSIA